MSKYEKADIERGLRELPSMIARQAVVLNEAETNLDNTKQELRVAEAREYIALSGKDIKVDILKANVTLATQSQQANVITANSEVRIAKIKVEELRDAFDSVRKAANILIEEMKSFETGVIKK